MVSKPVTNKQKLDYFIERSEQKRLGPCDERYVADGQRPLFTGKDVRVTELVTVGIDPGPRTHGLAIIGPAIRAFRNPLLFAGECDTDELLARFDTMHGNLNFTVMEWAKTYGSMKMKHIHLDETIGEQTIIRRELLKRGVKLYCVPRLTLITQLGVAPFSKGRRDKLVAQLLERLGYDLSSGGPLGASHTQAALCAALFNIRDARNWKYLVEAK